jgi:hypothetical protein
MDKMSVLNEKRCKNAIKSLKADLKLQYIKKKSKKQEKINKKEGIIMSIFSFYIYNHIY